MRVDCPVTSPIIPLTDWATCLCMPASMKSSSRSSVRNNVVKAHKWAPAEWPISTILSCKKQWAEHRAFEVRRLHDKYSDWVPVQSESFRTLSKLNFAALSCAQTKQSMISWTIPKTFPWRSEETIKVDLDTNVRFKSSCLLHNSRSNDTDFIFQSALLITPKLPTGSYLWVGAIIRADDCCAQLFRHLPGQQTVNGSFSKAPCTSVDKDHQRGRLIVATAQVWREVQVQFLAPAAKSDALQSVHSSRAFNLYAHYLFHAPQILVKQMGRNIF